MARENGFPKKVKQTLCDRVGGVCSNPECRVVTRGPNESSADRSQKIGEAAHIRALKKSDARFDEKQSSQDRNSIENGIWLCRNCHKMIDFDEKTYSVALLYKWKHDAEAEAKKRQGNPIPRQEDSINLLTSALYAAPNNLPPIAIGNVHKSVEQSYKDKLGDVQVETEYINKRTTVNITPARPKQIHFHPNDSSTIQSIEQLCEHGSEIEIPMDAFTIEKPSSTWNTILQGEVKFSTPRKEVNLTMKVKNLHTNEFLALGDIKVTLFAGKKSFTFRGSFWEGLLSLNCTSYWGGALKNNHQFSLTFDSWNGKNILDISHFDEVYRLVDFFRNGAQIDIKMSDNGLILAEFSGNSQDSDKFENTWAVLEYVKASRRVSNHFNIDIYFKESYAISVTELDNLLTVAENIPQKTILTDDDYVNQTVTMRSIAESQEIDISEISALYIPELRPIVFTCFGKFIYLGQLYHIFENFAVKIKERNHNSVVFDIVPADGYSHIVRFLNEDEQSKLI